MATASATPELKVYWQPGCTSCLRTKEFLEKRGVPFVSRNVLADEIAYRELAELGLRQVPIVSRGKDWVNGQVLADVARIAGVPYGATKQHPPAELIRRSLAVVDGAARFIGQLSQDQLETVLPNRPRTLVQLGYHLFNVVDAFVDHEEGIPLTFASYCREPEKGAMTKAELLAYHAHVRGRLVSWWTGPGQSADWTRKADVYYGDQTLHDYLERTTWHAGQHTRQLMWMMDATLGIAPDTPIGPETLGGLPMPESVWDPA